MSEPAKRSESQNTSIKLETSRREMDDRGRAIRVGLYSEPTEENPKNQYQKTCKSAQGLRITNMNGKPHFSSDLRCRMELLRTTGIITAVGTFVYALVEIVVQSRAGATVPKVPAAWTSLLTPLSMLP
jgi:hypothetical protein